jgi:uncharacterized membrane protein
MFGLFKKKEKNPITKEEQRIVVDAIRAAEAATSGEIRVFIESRCSWPDPLDRASEVFFKLKMDKTKLRNGVLVYVALQDHKMALYGDEGIYKKTGGPQYWTKEIELMRSFFSKGQIAEGIAQCVSDIGRSLVEYFPIDHHTDKNELPDEIVFGDHHD